MAEGASQSDPRRVSEPKIIIDLRLDYSRPDPNEPWLRVHGIVRDQFGGLLDGVTVQAFDRDLRSEQFLGSVPAREGHYDIRYKRSQFLRARRARPTWC